MLKFAKEDREMRLAFIVNAATDEQDATQRRRVAHLWRALVRILQAFPDFIDADKLRRKSQETNASYDNLSEHVWDIVVNATGDPNAADAIGKTACRIWAPPSDANTISLPHQKNHGAIWLWEDGPSSELHAAAEQILPDVYELAPDHSIATFPETALVAEPSVVETWKDGIAEILSAGASADIGVPAELAPLMAECRDFDEISVTPYDDLEAFGRASLVVSDFSPAYRDQAFTALKSGARAIPVGLGGDVVLGGTRFAIPQSKDELISFPAIEWSDTQQRALEDLTRSVKSALFSVPGPSIPNTTDLNDTSGFECALNRHFFNPHTRLLVAFVSCRCPMAIAMDIEGSAIIDEGGELPDVRCRKTSPANADDSLLLRIAAFLPPEISVENVTLRVSIEGVITHDLALPPDVTIQQAGFVSVECTDDDKLVVEHWSATPKTRVDCPGGEILKETVRRNSTGLNYWQSTVRWDTQAGNISVRPESGVGQTIFGGGKYIAPQDVSSEKLLQLKDAFRGQSAWLIGNGPSVRTSDLDRLQGRLCFAFNRFSLAYDRTRLRPQFTLCSDRQTIEDFFDEFAAQAGGMILRAQAERPEKSSTAEWLRVMPLFPPLFSRNPAVRVSAGGSSPFIAMQVAHFLGIRRLYLYGMDFTYRLRRNALSKDPMRGAIGEGNHFIDGYRAGLPWSPPNTLNILMAFLTAREIFAADGGFVRNASRGGALDIFERRDFEVALSEDQGHISSSE